MVQTNVAVRKVQTVVPREVSRLSSVSSVLRRQVLRFRVFDLQPRQGIFEATGDEVGGSCPFDAVQSDRL
jgi:hypothetical protein